MPVKRYQEYLALLKEVGAIRVSHEEEPAEVSFAIWGSGFAGETRHVWVCWLKREPPNTATSLEAFYETQKPRTPSYVHIDDNWYIGAGLVILTQTIQARKHPVKHVMLSSESWAK